jgi:hypothetical protein
MYGRFKCREVKTEFAERDKCKPVVLRPSLARNLEKPLMSLFGTEWRKRGCGLCKYRKEKGRPFFMLCIEG